MSIAPFEAGFFDDDATLAMGAAFDQACRSISQLSHAPKVRELLAKRIIEGAKNGELDAIRLHSLAIRGIRIDQVSVTVNERRRHCS